MKNTLLAIFAIFCLISCTKETLKDSAPDSLPNLDHVKSEHIDHVNGKLTTTYESGKVVVKTIPKDTAYRKSATARTTTATIEENISWEDPWTDYEAPEYELYSAPGRAIIGVRLERDLNYGAFTRFLGFWGYVDPPITSYTAANGQQATRTATIIGLTGWAGPIPGTVVQCDYFYFINTTYTYADGTVFTRQYPRTGSKVVMF